MASSIIERSVSLWRKEENKKIKRSAPNSTTHCKCCDSLACFFGCQQKIRPFSTAAGGPPLPPPFLPLRRRPSEAHVSPFHSLYFYLPPQLYKPTHWKQVLVLSAVAVIVLFFLPELDNLVSCYFGFSGLNDSGISFRFLLAGRTALCSEVGAF